MTPRRAATGVVVLAGILALGQVVLIVSSWNSAAANGFYWRPAALIQTVIGFEFALVGGLIAVRRPENRIGWLLLAGAAGLSTYFFVSEYALYGEVVAPGSLPLVGVAAVLTQTTWAVPFGTLTPLLLLYPTGRPLSRRWGFTGVPALLGASTLLVVGTVQLWPLRADAGAILFPQADAGAAMSTTVMVGTTLLLASVIPAVVHVVVRWRRSTGVERLQMRWLVPTGLLLILGSIINGLVANGSTWGEIALLGGLFSLPASIGIAVLRYRLYDIDRIISRAISYTVVSGVLALLYAAVVVLPSTVLRLDSNLLVAAATLAAAAAFVPLRRRVQTAVDRRFDRSRYDAALVVDQFKAGTREQTDLDDLLEELHDVIGRAVTPASTSIWIKQRH